MADSALSSCATIRSALKYSAQRPALRHFSLARGAFSWRWNSEYTAEGSLPGPMIVAKVVSCAPCTFSCSSLDVRIRTARRRLQ
jgi:hypothetical protein